MLYNDVSLFSISVVERYETNADIFHSACCQQIQKNNKNQIFFFCYIDHLKLIYSSLFSISGT